MKNKHLTIGIDISEIASAEKTGSEVFALNLITNILKIDNKNSYLFYTYQDFDKNLLPLTTNYQIRKLITKHQTLWENLYLPYLLIKDRPDIFVSLNHLGPIYCPVKYLTVILDLAFIAQRETFKKIDRLVFKLYAKRALNISDQLIAISQSTKKDIIKYFNLDPQTISTIYLGYNRQSFYPRSATEIKAVLNKYNIDGKYLLFIGTLQKRKNIARLISAYAILKKVSKIDDKLVIVGKKGWLYNDIFLKIKELNLTQDVILTGYVPNADLPPLLSGATVFILPSLYEGFGLPLLEAMACGTPVIASRVSSLPEVVGQAGLLINDPYSVREISQKICQLTGNKNLQKELRERGLRQAQKFSWERCAAEFLTIIKNVTNTKIKKN